MSNQESKYPGGSRSRVNKAGRNIKNNTATQEDLDIIDTWRAAHRNVLNSFQAILRNRAKRNKGITIAQRLKRKSTIFNKLMRVNGIELSRMDDIAGCRIIFKNEKDLINFRRRMHHANFNHKLKNNIDKYNYIDNPKSSGYRGIHDIYEYDVKSFNGDSLKGLNIEIQYRTLAQHAWATANEVVGMITSQQTKFGEADANHMKQMALASEIIARAYENRRGYFSEMINSDVIKEFLNLDNVTGIIGKLRGASKIKKDASEKKNYILIFDADLQIKEFDYATDALKELFVLESKMPGVDIVFVKADSGKQMQQAFRNYFKDAKEFLRMIDDGCERLRASDAAFKLISD